MKKNILKFSIITLIYVILLFFITKVNFTNYIGHYFSVLELSISFKVMAFLIISVSYIAIIGKYVFNKANWLKIILVGLVVVSFANYMFITNNTDKTPPIDDTIPDSFKYIDNITIKDGSIFNSDYAPEKNTILNSFFINYIFKKDTVCSNKLPNTAYFLQNEGAFLNGDLKPLSASKIEKLNHFEYFTMTRYDITYKYMLDDSYYTDKTIYIVSSVDDTIYLMSQTLYNNLQNNSLIVPDDIYEQSYDENELPNVPQKFIDYNYNKEIAIPMQFILIISLFFMGLSLFILFGRKEIKFLEYILSLPVGLISLAIFTALISLLHIKITQLTFLLFFISIFVCAIYKIVKKKPTIKLNSFLVSIFVFSIVVILAILYNKYYLSFDSTSNLKIGQMLANLGFSNAYIMPNQIAYGFFSTSIANFAYLFNANVLYAVYPTIFAIILIFICYATYNLSINKNYITLAVSISASIIILLCSEFYFHFLWILNNMAVSLMMAMFVFALVKLSDKIEFNKLYFFLALISSLGIIVSRTEGAMYVALFLIASSLLKIDKKTLYTLIFSLCSFVFLYNLIIFINLQNTNTAFWSLGKAALSILAIFASLVFNYLYNILTDRYPFVSKHSFTIMNICLIGFLIFVFVVSGFEVIKLNIKPLIINLTSPQLLPITLLLSLMATLLILKRNKISNFSFFIILGYIVLTFSTFLFRSQNGEPLPMRVGYGDSGRRLILQFIPFTLMLLIYNFQSYLNKEDNT